MQTIDGLHSNPDSIPAGEAGLVATNQADGSTGLMVGGFAAVLMGLVAAAVVGMRRLSAARR